MLEKIDAILPKFRTLAQADVVNGLTAAYCPIVTGDTALQPQQRLVQLQQFAILVYGQLHGSGPKAAPAGTGIAHQ
jgi:hypothetical protein